MSCCISSQLIPVKAYGAFTFESPVYSRASDLILPPDTNISVRISKGNTARWFNGVIDENNRLSVTIPNDGFFSVQYESFNLKAFVLESNDQCFFVVDGKEYNCIYLNFIDNNCTPEQGDFAFTLS